MTWCGVWIHLMNTDAHDMFTHTYWAPVDASPSAKNLCIFSHICITKTPVREKLQHHIMENKLYGITWKDVYSYGFHCL